MDVCLVCHGWHELNRRYCLTFVVLSFSVFKFIFKTKISKDVSSSWLYSIVNCMFGLALFNGLLNSSSLFVLSLKRMKQLSRNVFQFYCIYCGRGFPKVYKDSLHITTSREPSGMLTMTGAALVQFRSFIYK